MNWKSTLSRVESSRLRAADNEDHVDRMKVLTISVLFVCVFALRYFYQKMLRVMKKKKGTNL